MNWQESGAATQYSMFISEKCHQLAKKLEEHMSNAICATKFTSKRYDSGALVVSHYSMTMNCCRGVGSEGTGGGSAVPPIIYMGGPKDISAPQ